MNARVVGNAHNMRNGPVLCRRGFMRMAIQGMDNRFFGFMSFSFFGYGYFACVETRPRKVSVRPPEVFLKECR